MSQNYYQWLIELLVYWEGSVRPSDLGYYAGVTRQYASRKLKQYLNNHSEALVYAPSHKNYVAAKTFIPKYITGDANEYLNWLTGYSSSLVKPLPTQAVTLPTRHITPTFVRPIVRALREKRRLEVNYSAITNPNDEGALLCPTIWCKPLCAGMCVLGVKRIKTTAILF